MKYSSQLIKFKRNYSISNFRLLEKTCDKHQTLGEFQQAFDLIETYKNSKTTFGDPIQMYLTKKQAHLLYSMKDYNSCIQYWKTIRGQPFGITKQFKSKIYQDIGNCYLKMGFTEKGNEYIDESSFIYKQDFHRFIFIGDVHGCFDELMELLNKCNFDPSNDKLVFVGDMVGKGPKSKQVLEFAISNEAESVRGNHEDAILHWWISKIQNEPFDMKLPSTHMEITHNIREDEWKWLLNLPFYLEIDKFFVVHAGINPKIPIENQSIYDMMNMRSITKDGKVSYKVEDDPWAKFSNKEMIIFGHDAIRKFQKFDHAIGLDTGCVYGGQLTCAIYQRNNFSDLILMNVQSKEIYEKILK
jgi:predicted phosphodiesterase